MNRRGRPGSGTPGELASLARGGQEIYVSIRGPYEEVLARLKESEKLSEIKHLGEESGINRFELITDSAGDLSEEVFFMVANSGWSLTELYRKTIDLEDVFLDLTTREE